MGDYLQDSMTRDITKALVSVARKTRAKRAQRAMKQTRVHRTAAAVAMDTNERASKRKSRINIGALDNL